MRPHRILTAFCLVPSLFALPAQARQIRLDEVQKLSPTNPVGADKHGTALALEGDLLLVGTPGSLTTGSGFVYAYARTGGSFVLQQKFTFALGGPGASFGRRLDIDGNTAAIANYSSAFVYVRNGGTWTVQQQIASPVSPQFYGSSVAVDGDTILVGQAGMTENQVWVWARSGTHWALQQKMEPALPLPVTGFGQSVDLVGDTAVIGAPLDDQGGSNAGALFVFTRSGTVWTQRAKLLGAPVFANRRLGGALHLQLRPGGSFEVAVGASGPASGEVLLFEGSGASWTQSARILPTTGGSGSWFGNQVVLEGDILAAGAWMADASQPNSGLASVYRRCGSAWVRQADLVGHDSATDDNMGIAVVIEGSTAVVGAPSHDGTLLNGGATYVFDLESSPLSLFCPGDGSGSACPCGNEVAAGDVAGCLNSTGAGASLVLDDSIQASSDALTAHACGLVPAEPALLFAGSNRIAGGDGALFGDGLRCAGTDVVRLEIQVPDPQGEASFGPGLGATGAWGAGDTRHFQLWYRDPSGSPCGSGYNLSNGASVVFEP